MSFEENLRNYAKVLVRVGLNIQPGQEMLIGTGSFGKGTSLECRDLIRHMAEEAYSAGARLVSVIWEDDELTKIRLKHGQDLETFEHWKTNALVDCIRNGGATMRIYSNAPDTFADFDTDQLTLMQNITVDNTQEHRKATSEYRPSWLVTAAANVGWAKMIFPDLPEDEGVRKLWDAIFAICRATADDPLAAWAEHKRQLEVRGQYLTDKAYNAIRYMGPGTDLTIGLPANHQWAGGASKNKLGNDFTANIPTEEVFTLPHKDKVDGTVTATMPLAYGGTIIENFSLTFKEGVVVDMQAARGGKVLQNLLDTDEGARRLGEVSIVPHSSPISQSGLLFYNTLYDENAACHIAIGKAYRTLKDAADLTEEAFQALGGNYSKIHVDFMIGSAAMNIDGIYTDGTTEPILRNGEWAFDV